MRSRLSILTLICCFFVCFSIINVPVYANPDVGTSIKPTSPAVGPASCNYGNCLNQGTAGMRVALVDKRGDVVKINGKGSVVDYWYYVDANNYTCGTGCDVYYMLLNNSNRNYYAFDKKYLKQTIMEMDEKSLKNALKSKKGKSNVGSFDKEFKSIMTVYNISSWPNGYPSIKSVPHSRNSQSLNTVVKKMEEQAKKNDYTTFDTILKEMGYDVNHNNITNKGYYLQFEPLITWENAKIGGNNYVFYGTVSELLMIWNYKLVSPAFNDTNIEAFLGTLSQDGVYADDDKHMPNTFFSVKSRSGTSSNFVKKTNNRYGAYGVGYLDLTKMGIKISSRCKSDEVKTIYENYYGKKDYDKKIKEACGEDDCSHLYSSNLDKYGINNVDLVACKPPKCNTIAQNHTSEIKAADSIFDRLKKLLNARLKEDGKELLIESTNNGKVSNIFVYRAGLTDNTSNLCNPTTCNDLLAQIKPLAKTDTDKYKKKMGILYSLFSYPLLDLDLCSDLGVEPSCNSVPNCPVDDVTASCSENGKNNFTLSDTSLTQSKDSCLKKGYAYNDTDESGNVIAKTVQTSFDSEYGTDGYCWESVTFNFPTSVKNGIAGQVFKWGINGNSVEERQNKHFGTMTITRKCYFGKDFFARDTPTITSKWASVESKGGRINPKITINYTEAVPNKSSYEAKKVSANLNVSLATFNMDIIAKKGTYVTSDINKVEYTDDNESYDLNNEDYHVGGTYTNPRTHTCFNMGMCDNIDHVEMTATYNLNYGNEFKWYASVGSNSQYQYDKTNKKSSMTEDSDGYAFMGYGLPTSFVTPTNLKDNPNYSYGYSLQSDKYQGELYATVEQIGTKNRTGTGYHFDKMVKFAIKDDDKENNDKIVYSCGFNIKNHIFGYEDGEDPCPDGQCEESPKGLDVVFRPVDLVNTSGDKEEQLDKAFPGMSGTGRKIGANWAEWENGNPDIVEDKANNIYNILSNAIYNEEPMYEITLDVATIQKIRKYNKSARKTTVNSEKADPYSNMPSIDGTDTNGYIGYVCSNNSDESYKYCASNFLTKLKADSKISGSCISGNYGTEGSKSRAHVYSHASNGCNQSWWN